MMNRALHLKESLALVTVIFQFIVRHTVTHHDQFTRITTTDPVSEFIAINLFSTYTRYIRSHSYLFIVAVVDSAHISSVPILYNLFLRLMDHRPDHPKIMAFYF